MAPMVPFFQQVNLNFDTAAQFTDYPRGLLEQIKMCDTVCHMAFPVKRADGAIEVVHAWACGTQSSQTADKRRNPLQHAGQ